MEENLLTTISNAMVRAAETAGASTVQVEARRRGGASGIVYTPELVLAASHAVEREQELRITLPDGTVMAGQLAGRDPSLDLALLRLEHGAGVPAQAAAEEAKVGQIVLALGRPDGSLQASLGVVGAVGGPLRMGRGGVLERFIRTDAIPYPGFSGGPLIDGDGHVLGINTSGFAPGASLAIPAAQAWRAAGSLAQYGRVRRGYLGVRSQSVELPPGSSAVLGREQAAGLLLVGVERDQPAARAGLMTGDILVGLDGTPVEDHDTLLERLSGDAVGRALAAEILRGGTLVRVDIQPGEPPARE